MYSSLLATLDLLKGVTVYKHILMVFIIAVSFSTKASNFIDNKQTFSEYDCFSRGFSSYDSWRSFIQQNIEKKAKTPDEVNKRLARFDAQFGKEKFDRYKNTLDCSTFVYTVDDVPVKGYVIKPKNVTEKLPVLIYNRGGNGRYGRVVFGAMAGRLFPIAEQGFVIIGSQYRGSMSKKDRLDEFGGKDVNDVTKLIDLVPLIKDADPNRVGMYGASRGGMQTHLAMKQAKNIKAIATIAGQSDLPLGLTIRPAMERVYKHRIPNYEDNKVAELEKRSVINWVNELSPTVPILLMHGTADKRVSVKHSILLAEELTKHNIPHELVLYRDDNHGLWKHKQESEQKLVEWFKGYL